MLLTAILLTMLFHFNCASPILADLNPNYKQEFLFNLGGNFNNQNSNKYNNNNNNNNDQETTENETFDPSVFDTDGGESFFDFANRRVMEMQNQNKQQFEKAISECSVAMTISNSHHQVEEEKCSVGSLTIDNMFTRTADRLFLYDANTIGLISSQEASLKFLSFNAHQKTLTHLRTKYFRNEIPHDACVDKSRAIYVVFPDQNKIAKYVFSSKNYLFIILLYTLTFGLLGSKFFLNYQAKSKIYTM